MKEKAGRKTSTLRLILAAIKDRDIANRTKGIPDEISEDQILTMLQSMIKQRTESIVHFEQGGRIDMVEQEKEEIEIIKGFLPKALSVEEIRALVDEAISQIESPSIKNMGGIMKTLREHYPGAMDFKVASTYLKERLV